MKDITLKRTSLRTALAEAVLVVPAAVHGLIRSAGVDKGDVREAARLAGLMAVKKTAELLPHCHNVPIADADVTCSLEGEGLRIQARVRAIAPTGVEMEALTAVSVAALCAYDMLKPHCAQKDMRVEGLRLLEKRGGKSHFGERLGQPVSASVIVMSDSVAGGRQQDTAGHSLRAALVSAGFEPVAYHVLPDEQENLKELLAQLVLDGVALVATVGGTGLGPRDRTVEVVRNIVTADVPGLMEAARHFGDARTPYAMLSRGVAGFAQGTLIITFPGSRRGALETFAALRQGIVHLLGVVAGAGHVDGYVGPGGVSGDG